MSKPEKLTPIRRCELKMTLAVLEAFRDGGCKFDYDARSLYAWGVRHPLWLNLPSSVAAKIRILAKVKYSFGATIKRGPWLAGAIEAVRKELGE